MKRVKWLTLAVALLLPLVLAPGTQAAIPGVVWLGVDTEQGGSYFAGIDLYPNEKLSIGGELGPDLSLFGLRYYAGQVGVTTYGLFVDVAHRSQLGLSGWVAGGYAALPINEDVFLGGALGYRHIPGASALTKLVGVIGVDVWVTDDVLVGAIVTNAPVNHFVGEALDQKLAASLEVTVYLNDDVFAFLGLHTGVGGSTTDTVKSIGIGTWF